MPELGTEWARWSLIAERYRLESQLGAGGMGVVFRAHDERLGRAVAVKLLSAVAIGDSTARERVLREARSGAAIADPAIAHVYDVGETDDGGAYLVMELVHGVSLRELLRAGPLPRDEVAQLVSEVARGLALVHRAGIVHRDIKPDNIMRRDGGGVAILDLGLAKVVAPEDGTSRVGTTPLTTAHGFVGTPAYMPPEQAMGEPVDGRADAYALAVTAYELLTGRLPWQGTSAFAILAELMAWQAPPPSRWRAELGPEVDAVMARALAKRAAERFDDIESFAVRLAAALGMAQRTPPGAGGAGTLEPGELVAGRYRVVSLVRQTSSSQVYEAEDAVAGEGVALECLHGGRASSPRARQRLERALAQQRWLVGPGVARIRGIGAHGRGTSEILYCARDAERGETLGARMARGRLEHGDVEAIVRQLAAALDSAHEAGLVHGGLAPDHVSVASGPEVMLSGFGLVADGDEGGATTTSLVDCLSPEQIHGEAATARSDIYALGVIMFELVTGKLPFTGATPISAAARRLTEQPPTPRAHVPELAPHWEAIIVRCLARDPAERPARARDIVAALDGEPLPALTWAAAPPDPAARRGRGRWWLTMAAVGAGLVGLIVLMTRGTSDGRATAATGTPRQLTTTTGWASSPSLSPDGDLVAYVANTKGNADIWLMDARGGTPLQLTDDPADDVDPAWLPDGAALVFASHRGGSWGIWKVARLGGAATPVIGDAIEPTPSPDGQHVAFVRASADGQTAVWRAPLTDPSGARELVPASVGQLEKHHPAWSPDGLHIAFEDFANLWVIDASGGESRRLTTGSAADRRATWSSDGAHLYFTSTRTGTTALWRLSLDGDEPVRVTMGMGAEVDPAVSTNGARLAYATHRERGAVVIVDRRTGERTTSSELGDVYDLAIAPDGSALAVTAIRDGAFGLWRVPLAGVRIAGTPVRLTDLEGSVARPMFSPDGRWIAVHRRVDEHRSIWVLPAAGGLPRMLTGGERTDVQPTWSPDGKQIAFVASDQDGEQVWAVSLAEDGGAVGAPRRLTRDRGAKMQPLFAPDGRSLVYIAERDGGDDVWSLDLTAHDAEAKRLSDGAGALMMRWDAGGTELLVSGLWGGTRYVLRRLPAAGGPASGSGIADEPMEGIFDVAQGGALAFTTREQRGDIWVLDAPPETRY